MEYKGLVGGRRVPLFAQSHGVHPASPSVRGDDRFESAAGFNGDRRTGRGATEAKVGPEVGSAVAFLRSNSLLVAEEASVNSLVASRLAGIGRCYAAGETSCPAC